MEIIIDRKYKQKGYTISRVYLDGSYFGCNALEDEDRGLDQSMSVSEIKEKKIYGQTAIPTGRYKVTFETSPKFGKTSYAKNGLIPLINGVKGYSGVRIHAANKPEELEGCIAIGRNTIKGQITESKAWTKKLIDRLWIAWTNGATIWLTIK